MGFLVDLVFGSLSFFLFGNENNKEVAVLLPTCAPILSKSSKRIWFLHCTSSLKAESLMVFPFDSCYKWVMLWLRTYSTSFTSEYDCFNRSIWSNSFQHFVFSIVNIYVPTHPVTQHRRHPTPPPTGHNHPSPSPTQLGIDLWFFLWIGRCLTIERPMD